MFVPTLRKRIFHIIIVIFTISYGNFLSYEYMGKAYISTSSGRPILVAMLIYVSLPIIIFILKFPVKILFFILNFPTSNLIEVKFEATEQKKKQKALEQEKYNIECEIKRILEENLKKKNEESKQLATQRNEQHKVEEERNRKQNDEYIARMDEMDRRRTENIAKIIEESSEKTAKRFEEAMEKATNNLKSLLDN